MSMKITGRKAALLAHFILFAMPALASAQSEGSPRQDAGGDGIGIAPARFELPMLPGTERTVVVNIIYNSETAEARPCRLVAYTSDWTILRNGDPEFLKAGTQPRSASPWLLYSPGEVTAMPGKVHPIRVTISVPEDAAPGDHLAALLVESRPDNIKLEQDRRQLVLRFRMAALFYIMVPDLTRKGALEDLKAEHNKDGIIITPTLKNDGNSRVRPVHSVKIVDEQGAIVAELPEAESVPVLGRSELSSPLVLGKALPPGSYQVRYRVDFKDGGPVTEGQTDLVVREPVESGERR